MGTQICNRFSRRIPAHHSVRCLLPCWPNPSYPQLATGGPPQTRAQSPARPILYDLPAFQRRAKFIDQKPATASMAPAPFWSQPHPAAFITTGRSAAAAKPILAISPRAHIHFTGGTGPLYQNKISRACQLMRPAPVPFELAPAFDGGLAESPARSGRVVVSSRTGFICTLGGTLAALACTAWARPISPPSGVTAALFDIFCGFNGHTATPDWPAGGTARRPAGICPRLIRFP